jgi:hypothetical protein
VGLATNLWLFAALVVSRSNLVEDTTLECAILRQVVLGKIEPEKIRYTFGVSCGLSRIQSEPVE